VQPKSGSPYALELLGLRWRHALEGLAGDGNHGGGERARSCAPQGGPSHGGDHRMAGVRWRAAGPAEWGEAGTRRTGGDRGVRRRQEEQTGSGRGHQRGARGAASGEEPSARPPTRISGLNRRRGGPSSLFAGSMRHGRPRGAQGAEVGDHPSAGTSELDRRRGARGGAPLLRPGRSDTRGRTPPSGIGPGPFLCSVRILTHVFCNKSSRRSHCFWRSERTCDFRSDL
jgi:hypothetical protein